MSCSFVFETCRDIATVFARFVFPTDIDIPLLRVWFASIAGFNTARLLCRYVFKTCIAIPFLLDHVVSKVGIELAFVLDLFVSEAGIAFQVYPFGMEFWISGLRADPQPQWAPAIRAGCVRVLYCPSSRGGVRMAATLVRLLVASACLFAGGRRMPVSPGSVLTTGVVS